MRGIGKASRRPRRLARATGGGFPNALRPGLSGGVALGSRCPAPPRHALLAENPNLEAWGKPSLWVIISAPWYQSFSRGSNASRMPSPKRLKPRTVIMMAMPGKNTRCGALNT